MTRIALQFFNLRTFVRKILPCGIVFASLLFMGGWYSGESIFFQHLFPQSHVHFSTSLAFFFGGLAIVLHFFGAKKSSSAFSSLMGIIGLSTLSQYIFNVDLSIDQNFANSDLIVSAFRERIPPSTALCLFLLAGVQIHLSLFPLQRLFQALAATAVTIVIGTILISLSGLSIDPGIMGHNQISLFTSLILLMIVGLDVYSMAEIEPSILTKWAGFYVGGISIIGSAFLWQMSQQTNAEKMHKGTALRISFLKDQLQSGIEDQKHALERMAARLATQSYSSESSWSADADLHMSHWTEMLHLYVMDHAGRVNWHAAKDGTNDIPEESLHILPQLYERSASGNLSLMMMHNRQVFVIAPIRTNEGDQSQNGFVVALQNLNALLKKASKSSLYEFEFFLDDALVYSTFTEKDEKKVKTWSQQDELRSPAVTLSFNVMPNEKNLHDGLNSLPFVILFTTLTISILMGLLTQMLVRLRRQAQSMREEQKFSQSVTDLLPSNIYILDLRTMNTVYSNRNIADMTGFTIEQIKEKGPNLMASLLHPEDFQARIEAIKTIKESRDGEIINLKRRVRHADGGYRWILSRETVFKRNAAGEVTQIIGLSEDITKRKLEEEEIQITNTKLRKATEAKSQFLANTSHEIRTPLSSIAGLTSLLLDTELTIEQREFSESIRDSVELLTVLISDILDMSKIEAGKLELIDEDFFLIDLIRQVEKPMAFAASQKNINFHVSIDRLADRLFVRGDTVRIKQILTNLLHNAIKFTMKGKVQLTVSVGELSTQAAKLTFKITDTGVGIGSQDLPNLFSPFVQVEASASRRFGGTGLGLSICKSLVNLMDGAIGVDSVENAGSEFWFTLSLPRRSSVKEHATITSTEQESMPSGVRILLAEDNPMNSKITVAMLKKYGYDVEAVSSGVQVLARLGKGAFDAVLMDCQMPEMDGFQATRHIRDRKELAYHRIPIIALTASAMTPDRERCLTAGMDAFISKPFKAEELVEVIEKVRISNHAA